MTINCTQCSPTQQRNQSISQEDSISNAPKDQMTTLVSEIANVAIAACSQSSSVESLSKEIAFELPDQNQYQKEHQKLCIKALTENSYLSKKDISVIGLGTPIPEGLKEKYKGCTAILSLLKEKFPLLTESLFKKEIKVLKSVISFLNHEGESNPSLQIQAEGEIVFISSASQVVKKPEKHTYNISFGWEEKVTVIGILIAEQEGLDFFKDLFKPHKPAYDAHDSDSHRNCRCIPKSLYKNLPYISKDREKNQEKHFIHFAWKLLQTKLPIQKIDLLKAIKSD